MHKISLIVCSLLLALPGITSAQYSAGTQELSLSYGRQSGTDILQGFGFNRTAPNFDHPTFNSATSKSGNIFVSYSYFVASHLAIGVTAGTEFVSFNHYQNGDPIVSGYSVPLGSFKANITTLAFELRPIYYNGRLVQLYALIGTGARYYSQTLVAGNNNTPGKEMELPSYMINTQFTPIGVHVGKTLSGFLEIGLGYKGLINGGISYKLARKAKPAAAKAE